MLRRLFYQSEPVNGKPTRVFADDAQPAVVVGRLPAIVLVHGGGGTAYPDWALMWAKRGYAALAMDLNGWGPGRVPLPDGGPSLAGPLVIPVQATPLTDVWSYHAVAAVIRGVSLLRSLPQVNPFLVSVHGISGAATSPASSPAWTRASARPSPATAAATCSTTAPGRRFC